VHSQDMQRDPGVDARNHVGHDGAVAVAGTVPRVLGAAAWGVVALPFGLDNAVVVEELAEFEPVIYQSDLFDRAIVVSDGTRAGQEIRF
jgi:hypothetical protein